MSGRVKGWLIALGSAILFVLASWLLLALWPYPELTAFLASGYSTRVLDRRGELVSIVPLEGGLHREFTSLDKIPGSTERGVSCRGGSPFLLAPGREPAGDPPGIPSESQRKANGLRRLHHHHAACADGEETGRWLARQGGGGVGRPASGGAILQGPHLRVVSQPRPVSFQAEGVASASRLFFGRPLAELRPEEAILLTVIPRRPSLYNPFTNPSLSVETAFRLAQESGLARRWNLRGVRGRLCGKGTDRRGQSDRSLRRISSASFCASGPSCWAERR